MNAHRLLPKLLLSAAVAAVSLTGCKSNPPAQPAPVTSQGVPTAGPVNSDGSQAAPQQQAAQAPQRYAEPAREPERRRASAEPKGIDDPPPPLPARPVVLEVPTGTRIVVRTSETLSASRNDVGDGFSGELEEPILSGNSTVFPRGTRVSGTVVAAKGRGRFKGEGAIGIEIATIGSVRVHTSEYEKASKGKGKRTGTLIGGGAGLGALIGGLAGGGKGAVIGGLAGAGAGTAGAAYTGNKDVVIPAESVLTFSLLEPLRR